MEKSQKLTSGQTYTFQAKLNDATIMDSGWVQNLSMSKGTIKQNKLKNPPYLWSDQGGFNLKYSINTSKEALLLYSILARK